MPRCPNCGESLSRTHRNIWEKFVYSLVFKCRGCALRVGEKHTFLNYFAPHAHCPRCGTDEIDRRNTRDKIDKMIKTPVSLLQALLGGSLYHCVFCRIQFYDLRSRVKPSSVKPGPNPLGTGSAIPANPGSQQQV